MSRARQLALAAGCGLVIGLIVSVSLRIALDTRPNAHPDEYWHADAFRYYEQQWWPPALNADGLEYDPAGSNRVFYGEAVYLIFGRAAAVVRWLGAGLAQLLPPPAVEAQPHQLYLPQVATVAAAYPPIQLLLPLYRLLNTGLLFITLVGLACAGRRRPGVLALGLTVVCVPQVVYVYSYANSDAWGLSVSLGLLVFAWTQRRVLESYPKLLGLGVLAGLLFAAKQSYWLALPLAGLVLAQRAWADYGPAARLDPAGRRGLARRVVVAAAVAGLAAVMVMAPWRIVYPLSQGDFAARELAMREARAMESLKPSHPTYPGYRLADRGVPFGQVVLQREWYDFTAWSFYGLFGYMSTHLTDRVYRLAFGLGLVNLGLTLVLAFKPGSQYSRNERYLCLAALGTVLLCLAASLYNSWTFDNQPQGRYLFGALGALSLLLWGQWVREPRWARLARVGSGALLVALSVYVLVRYILLNSSLLT